ncbi:MAG: hypothetical protein ACYCWW_05185 [Deltaproteobacteria bacterium]
MRRALLAALALAAACGSTRGGSPVGLPQLTLGPGPVLSSVKLVTITYANDPLRATDEAFGDWIVTSAWFATVGKDYGVGPGTQKAKVELAETAPSQIADYGIDGALTQWIADGTVPAPDAQTLYLVYYPPTTSVTDAANDAISCTIAAGYHSEDHTHSPSFAYAVVPTCSSADPVVAAAEVQGAASHELIEAATDPLPDSNPGWQLAPTNPWVLARGGVEVGDLCFPLGATEDGYTLSGIWSNSAAAAGDDPCVPSSGAPYYTVYATPSVVALQPGGQARVTLVGWANAAVPSWPIAVSVGPGQQGLPGFTPTATLSVPTVGDGLTATLTLQAPAGAPSGASASIVVFSSPVTNDPGVSGYEALYAFEATVL